jgi:signal transduction histidine kinase
MRVVEFEAGSRSLWLGVDVTPYKRQLEDYKRRERLLLRRIDSSARLSKPAVPTIHHADYGLAALPIISTLRNDLLTPINTINSFAQLLSKYVAPTAQPTFRELLAGILTQSTQLRALLRDIVNVGHLVDASTRTWAEPDRIKPSALVKDVLGNLNYTTRHAHLSIQEGAISSKTVETDERALRAVMLQALTGIVEMTPSGGKVGVEANLRHNTIVLRIATAAADRDIAAVMTASKTLSMCEHAARFYGGGFEFTSGSDSGIAAELHWPLQPTKRQRRAAAG